MKKAKIKKAMKLTKIRGEERDLLERNLNAIQSIVRRAQRAKEHVLLTDEDANDIDELAGEILVQMEVVL